MGDTLDDSEWRRCRACQCQTMVARDASTWVCRNCGVENGGHPGHRPQTARSGQSPRRVRHSAARVRAKRDAPRRARGGGGGTLSVGKVFDMAVRGVLILLVGLLVVTLIGLTAVESVSWAALLNLGAMVFALVLYFLPALVAQERRHTKAVAIFVLDLFLGWTFLGWVGALVWAFTEDNRDRATEAGVNDPASTARG
ncbi:superinfection immunity protein [Marichromatium sp. AB32]|uniref:superinfection immunity protein n=1 Tax=Marichromatium sp. AB32 TaxID=2483363 RepID=UPI001CC20086|nr:superinfection immunity protein [Marichromatium sp. AB32]